MENKEKKQRNERELNDRQEAFCREYILDRNRTQAALRAGYSTANAGQVGDRLYRNVKIRTKINNLLQERNKRTDITADDIILQLKHTATGDVRCLYDELGNPKRLCDLTREEAYMVQGVKTEGGFVKEYKIVDKNKSTELLLRALGAFSEKVELTTTAEIVQYQIPNNGRD